jgi:ribonuclease HI
VGYGAVGYIAHREPVEVHLVASKSRLTPTNSLSIPRLELLGVVTAFRLAEALLTGLRRLRIGKITIWTDSLVVEGQI